MREEKRKKFNSNLKMFFATVLLLAIAEATMALKFTVLGDWGGQSDYPYTTRAQLATADGMSTVTQQDFILALGDNFYNDGVESLQTNRFEATWNQVYPSSTAAFNVPWHLLAGNHDHKRNVTAQIDFTKVDSTKRWSFPSPYYTIQKSFNNITMDIVMIDTVLLTGSWEDGTEQPAHELEFVKSAGSQWTWIEQQLRQSKADWLLVAGHYPIYSIAEHGPTDDLVDNLLPLMEKYGAAMYLCGHEHNAQFLRVPGVDMIVSGAGHGLDDSRRHEDDVPSGSLRFHYAGSKHMRDDEGMFAVLEVDDANTLHTAFLDADGSVHARFDTPNPRKQRK